MPRFEEILIDEAGRKNLEQRVLHENLSSKELTDFAIDAAILGLTELAPTVATLLNHPDARVRNNALYAFTQSFDARPYFDRISRIFLGDDDEGARIEAANVLTLLAREELDRQESGGPALKIMRDVLADTTQPEDVREASKRGILYALRRSRSEREALSHDATLALSRP